MKIFPTHSSGDITPSGISASHSHLVKMHPRQEDKLTQKFNEDLESILRIDFPNIIFLNYWNMTREMADKGKTSDGMHQLSDSNIIKIMNSLHAMRLARLGKAAFFDARPKVFKIGLNSTSAPEIAQMLGSWVVSDGMLTASNPGDSITFGYPRNMLEQGDSSAFVFLSILKRNHSMGLVEFSAFLPDGSVLNKKSFECMLWDNRTEIMASEFTEFLWRPHYWNYMDIKINFPVQKDYVYFRFSVLAFGRPENHIALSTMLLIN